MYAEALRVLNRAEKLINGNTTTKGDDMADNRALFCEYKGDGGEHAFAAKKGYVELEVRIHGADDVGSDNETRTFCLPHAGKANLIQPPPTVAVAEISDGRYGVDKESFEGYTRWLEKQELELG